MRDASISPPVLDLFFSFRALKTSCYKPVRAQNNFYRFIGGNVGPPRQVLAPGALYPIPVGDDMLGLPTTPAGDDVDDELCAMFDESSQCTIVLPEERLGYGPVGPFLVCRFARFDFA